VNDAEAEAGAVDVELAIVAADDDDNGADDGNS
jgi:hypothetical protein